MTEYKIAIIIPYFGKWPVWIDLYFYSCTKNPLIDWFFFTDCDIPHNIPSNMHFYETSFSAYCSMVGGKLKIDFNPSNPYKLCGLKPFLGYIHKGLLQNYDFWGFGDVDVVWGDIKKFYTVKMLKKFDVFSTHADRVSGHFAIVRNTNYYRKLCFRIENWQLKLQDEAAIAMDEADFSWLIYPQSKYINKLYSKVIGKLLNWRDAWVVYYTIVPILNFLFLVKQKNLYFQEQHTTPILSDDGLTCKHDADCWFYMDGRITNNKTEKEYIYLHFMIFKKNTIRENYFWKEDFYNVSSEINDNDLIVIDKSGIQIRNNE